MSIILDREPLLFEDENGEGIREDVSDETLNQVQPDSSGQGVTINNLSSVVRSGFLFRSINRSLLSKWPLVEAKELLKLSIPTVLMLFFQQFLYIISILFAGHISESSRELDAAALASSVINVTGLSLIIGLSAAADTLCPQNFGFKNYKRVGEILQQGILIVSIAILPVIAVWLNSESLLLALKQPPCVAVLASRIIMVYILALPPLIVYTMLQKYLQAQSTVWVFVATGVIQNVLTVVFNALFIFGFNLGVISVSISMVIAMYISVAFLVLYIKWRGLHKLTWGGWSSESLRNWWLFIKLGLPGFFMIAVEWWTFEISVLVSGSISETELGVNTILLQVGVLAFMFAYGNGTAASVRVGNELGAGNPVRAKRASYTAVFMQFIIAGVIVVSLGLSHGVVARLFTDNEDVISETSYTMYVALVVFFCDQIQGVLSGVFRGSGRQLLAASINFFVYYVIGLPLGISLALLTYLKILGMWIGLAVATGLQACIFFGILMCTNWEKQSKRAIINVSGGKPSLNSVSHSNTESEDTQEGEIEMNDINSSKNDSIFHDLAARVWTEKETSDSSPEDHIPLVSSEDVEERLASLGEEQSTLLAMNDDIPSLDTHQPHSKFRKETIKLLLYRSSFVVIGLILVVIGAVFAIVFRHEELDLFCADEGITNSSCDMFCQNEYMNSDFMDLSMPSPTHTIRIGDELAIQSTLGFQSLSTISSTILSCSCSVLTQSTMIKPTPIYLS